MTKINTVTNPKAKINAIEVQLRDASALNAAMVKKINALEANERDISGLVARMQNVEMLVTKQVGEALARIEACENRCQDIQGSLDLTDELVKEHIHEFNEKMRRVDNAMASLEGNKPTIHAGNKSEDKPNAATLEGMKARLDAVYNLLVDKQVDAQLKPEKREKPKRKHKGWINIYPNGMSFLCGGSVHATEHEAKLKGSFAVATIQIEWEE